ncbi:MAG: lytic murein transglycosylase B [Acidiferrobacterales bacterium]|nr:lytic murein transglycosylase B [Acidiferrobacterales bacterium]
MMHKFLINFALLIVTLPLCASVSAISINQHEKLRTIAAELVAEKHYTQQEIEQIFAAAQVQQSVLNAMKNPAEYKLTWGKYRKIFLQPDRIEQAVEFWRDYQSELQRAEQEYGVPANIIVAIIGVESKFGRYKGKHKVLDSLVSLVVDYPRRSEFFAKELKHFLILTKENQMDTVNILGSYAGAVGYPQFIASSYRSYAVDFSGDGKTDLIDQPIDAIGSVANYFVKNGWLTGEPVTSVAYSSVPNSVADLSNNQRKIQFSAAQLREMGAPLGASIEAQEKLNVLKLNASEIVPEEGEANTYIVRAGDTACQIAERFSMPCKSLFELNGLNSQGAIYRGQRLKVNNKSASMSETDNLASLEQFQYFFTHENFYVITRYNHSVLYAMAVHDLSVAIQQEKMRQDGVSSNSRDNESSRAMNVSNEKPIDASPSETSKWVIKQ